MTLTSGQLLAQRYRLNRRIAIGGMGEVWEAADTRLDRPVAVKVLKPELSGDAEFRNRFHTEARMTASLNHPGIAAVHDYGETAGETTGATAYLVMELVVGEPLGTILIRQPRLPVDHTLDILEQAAHALQAAHERGVVHRDIKPGNILITPDGKVKLTDFGIARAVDAAPVTRNGMVLGTAHYIAPEQATGNEAGPAGDVYSLAVVGYECLAGQRPFLADSAVTVAMMHIRDTPPPLPRDVPSGARALIETTLVKDPRQRYSCGGEFAAAVAAVRAGNRLPLPAGMAGTRALSGAARSLAGNHPSQTALLPLGTLSDTEPGPSTGAHPAASYPPPSRLGRRSSAGIVTALLAALVLVFSGYLVSEALRVNRLSPTAGSTGTTAPLQRPAPTLPLIPNPLEYLPNPLTDEQSPPQPSDPDERRPRVFVDRDHYVDRSGIDAAKTAISQGLKPLVVDDEDGQPLSPVKWSRCRVVDVDPDGPVQRGQILKLTCGRPS